MKKISKLIAVIACLALICSVFAGCGSEKAERVQTDGKEFDFWVTMDGSSAATLESYDEMLFYQEMEKATGVHINFIHPIQGSTGGEAFLTMISGTDLPDMIQYTWALYTGGPQGAIDDGILIALNDYLEEYAPNFYNYVLGDEAKKRDYSTTLSATTEQGNFYGFNVLNLGKTEGFCGLYARGDLLEKWGMSVPETIDEWTAFLAKAKEEGFDKPLTGTDSLLSYKFAEQHSFNTAYDVGKAFYLEGDKVVWGPKQKGYKEFTAQMAEWYAAGYIDPGIITNDGVKVESNLVNQNSVASWGFIGSGLGKIGPALKTVDPSYELVACPYPVPEKGKVAEFQQMCADATTVAIGITTQCGNYEKAVSWCDWIYSEEGIPTQLFGKEGYTYTVEEIDGEKHYIYTDKVLNWAEEGFSSQGQAMYHYGLPANSPGYNQHDDYVLNYYQEEYQINAVETWNLGAAEAAKHSLPGMNYTPEEDSELTDIIELVRAPVDVVIYDIIMGKTSIDTYDEQIEKYWELGYKRYVEIVQGVYDRYVARKDEILG